MGCVERSLLQSTAPIPSSQDTVTRIMLRVLPLQVKMDLRATAGQSQQEGPGDFQSGLGELLA